MINPSAFEKVTALTDFLMGILVVYIAYQFRGITDYKASIWRWAFGLLALASFLGVVAHGLDMSESIRAWVWKPLNLSLGLALGFFVVGAVHDMWGKETAHKVLPFMIALGIVFFCVTILIPGTFLTFVAYEALAMFFALGVYGILSSRGTLPGTNWMALGVIITIIAAVVQATGKPGNSILWYFDNNGIFHLIQMIGVWLLMIGLKKSF